MCKWMCKLPIGFQDLPVDDGIRESTNTATDGSGQCYPTVEEQCAAQSANHASGDQANQYSVLSPSFSKGFIPCGHTTNSTSEVTGNGNNAQSRKKFEIPVEISHKGETNHGGQGGKKSGMETKVPRPETPARKSSG